MPYCTQADMETAFGQTEILQLTDHDDNGSVDIAVLDAAIAAAGSDIDKRLRAKGWSLPLQQSSADLTRIACDITRFYLHDNAAPDQIEKAFKRRLSELDAYVRGELAFDIGEPVAVGAGDVDYYAPDRVFDSNSLDGF